MKKIALAVLLTMIPSILISGQNKGDYKKGEFYVGYSNVQFDTGIDPDATLDGVFDDHLTHHGFEVAGVYNINRYFGLKGDFSGTYNRTNFREAGPGGSISFNTKSSLYNFLGGIQIKNNSSSARFKPFVHALAGVGHDRIKVSNVVCTTIDCSGIALVDGSDTGFAAALGGGLDIKLSNHVDLRAIQVDYNPTRFGDLTQQNIRFGVGIVFR